MACSCPGVRLGHKDPMLRGGSLRAEFTEHLSIGCLERLPFNNFEEHTVLLRLGQRVPEDIRWGMLGISLPTWLAGSVCALPTPGASHTLLQWPRSLAGPTHHSPEFGIHPAGVPKPGAVTPPQRNVEEVPPGPRDAPI